MVDAPAAADGWVKDKHLVAGAETQRKDMQWVLDDIQMKHK